MAEIDAASARPVEVDAFILHNEREEAVPRIVEGLAARGITTYFWRRDVDVGEKWKTLESERLRLARLVLVFLGATGWGPNHKPLAGEAQKLGKRILPVLIGPPPTGAITELDGLFEETRYFDLQTVNESALNALADVVRRRPRAAPFSAIISRLVDGSDEERSQVLQQVIEAKSIDRQGLSARLRNEILNRFSQERESQFGSADREPKKIASIRSWMLSTLIWLDAEEAPNRELFLSHLDQGREHDRNVRFWVLAGLSQRNVTYIAEAVKRSLSDKQLEVSLLAQAILSRDHADTINRCRSMLYSAEFDTSWAVLRVLRVVPISALARDVCAQINRAAEGTELTYDSLYALANPIMIAAASPILMESPGLRAFVSIVVAVLTNSDGNAAKQFAILLMAFELSLVEQALAEAERDDPETRGIVRNLRRYIRKGATQDANPELFVAGYASDTIDVKNDYLDIREDVQTLTAVMLANEVTPPLAIGLFGDWGSGKSFFMQSMKEAARTIADTAKATPNSKFCSNVVSVEFNAWHYADTNLWASLVTHILERLAAHVSPTLSQEEQQAVLMRDLESARSAVSQIESEKESTDKQIQDRQTELQDLQVTRQKKEIELRDLRFADLQTILASDSEVKGTLDDALAKVGVPMALTTVADLGQAVTEVNSLRGRATAFLVGLFSAQNKVLVISLVLALIAIPFVAAWLHHKLASSFVTVGTIVAETSVFIAGLTAFFRNAASHVKTYLDKFAKAKQQVDKLIAKKREAPDEKATELEKEIASLKAQEEQVASRMRAATAKVIDLEQKIASLKESRSLQRFLTERTQSDDYRKHLGLISTIRRDFEALTSRLTNPPADQAIGPVERIILYIDDLDRCPADKVVDVLQAVHLLLAYRLFVVVVGVDPRWLAHSLAERYAALKSGGETASDLDSWRTTPQNYLEKIFQIPVSLRPMTSGGYAKLVQGLFAPAPIERNTQDASKNPEPKVRPPVRDTRNPQPGDKPETTGQGPNQGGVMDTPNPSGHDDETRENGGASKGDKAFSIHEEALIVKDIEATFAERLYRLIPSPRAAKRFSNIYRILKAPTTPEQLPAFEGTEQFPGTFQVPMLLLAILIGMPAEAAVLFPRLYEHVSAGNDPSEGFATLELPDISENKVRLLRQRADEIMSDKNFPQSSDLFVYWLPRVSRFSFEIGRAINPALVGRQSL